MTASFRRAQAAALLGAAILVADSMTRIPWGEALFRRPRTPFDRSAANSVVPGYALLASAAAVIPENATVVARTEPPNPIQETYFHRFAISLLPGRRVLPSAFYGGFLAPDVWKDAQYVIVVGPRPATPPGTLVFETQDGGVWRREAR